MLAYRSGTGGKLGVAEHRELVTWTLNIAGYGANNATLSHIIYSQHLQFYRYLHDRWMRLV
ncbi:hypothetical protein PHLGIDRAFT_445360 [Phlebiopsis gigantea 11061_1 CR5-6]|uniref:Uncharacterized protein n=1 Tax=Phlebiopsis gigantea (strain 11061_1 CR5-6) TaxID=745531 RepID=A0A0C3NNZ0_PHLG1|nr:hypothetical protein PHLGIDRAFT_445360 [Phlebiopsis gigantea 11061_1 CR5-6]